MRQAAVLLMVAVVGVVKLVKLVKLMMGEDGMWRRKKKAAEALEGPSVPVLTSSAPPPSVTCSDDRLLRWP